MPIQHQTTDTFIGRALYPSLLVPKVWTVGEAGKYELRLALEKDGKEYKRFTAAVSKLIKDARAAGTQGVEKPNTKDSDELEVVPEGYISFKVCTPNKNGQPKEPALGNDKKHRITSASALEQGLFQHGDEVAVHMWLGVVANRGGAGNRVSLRMSAVQYRSTPDDGLVEPLAEGPSESESPFTAPDAVPDSAGPVPFDD